MGRARSQDVAGARLLLALIALIWAGMLIGVSGLATPVKFSAPSLTLPVALDVGRVTFATFSRVEWAFAAALIAAGVATKPAFLPRLLIALVVALVASQALWLLPVLDERIAAVIAGNTPPPSQHHVWYVVFETIKLAALTATGICAIRGGRRRRARPVAVLKEWHRCGGPSPARL